jgi:glycosyltransferase involved in cell wall biosynthesis
MTLILNQKVKNTSVSVIVPTCNRRDMLGRCLSSILSQTLQPFEIIVVNDAGEPVADIIAEHNSSGLIRYETHTTNQGASAARNTGLRLAKGAYIAYLDDDDTYLPSHLQTVVSALQSSECRFGYSYAEYVIDDRQDGAIVHVGRVQPYSDIPYSRDRLLVNNFIPTPTWVFERTLLESVGYFDEHFAACEDWEWLIRASEKTDFLTVPIVTIEVRQRLHDDQHLIVQHRPKMNMWIKAVYKKHPVTSPRLKMARQELLTFGAAKSLNSEQSLSLMTALESAKNQSLDLVQLINIAEMLTMANLRWRAVELYQVWLKHNGNSPLRHAALFNLSVSLKSLGHDAEADAACRAAIEISPKFNMARFLLASFQEQKGNIAEALKIWLAIANQEPNSTTEDSQTALNHIKRNSVQYRN